MKILAIRFRNLNSLVGEWSIDLRHPAYEEQGLFAITGPTGAGKTTILDAVCLALYGRTPRLVNVKKSGNEIMSRQTGDCFAEVLFRVGGQEFRCHWSQRRARKKPSGELQDPRHELSCGDKVLESSIKGVARRVEELTGMDFARFTRAVLLAQGDFAAFLQGTADERSSILEKITGTEIYSRISARVHERCALARRHVEMLREKAGDAALIDPGQESRCRAELADAEQAEAVLERMADDVEKALDWRGEVRRCREEMRRAQAELDALDREKALLAPLVRRLERDADARLCADSLRDAERCRESLKELENALMTEQQTLEALTEELRERRGVVTEAEAAAARLRDEAAARLPLLREARKQDAMLAVHRQHVGEARTSLASVEELYAGRTGELRELEAQEAALLRRREANETAVRDTEGDADLFQELPRIRRACDGVTERGAQWREARAGADEAGHGVRAAEQDAAQSRRLREGTERRRAEERRQREALEQKIQVLLEGKDAEDWQAEERRLAERAQRLEELGRTQEELRAATEARAEREQSLQALLTGHERQKDTLEREAERLGALEREEGLLKELYMQQRAISAYEEARRHLHDGSPCPLCGALEHPYAAGVTATPDDALQRLKAQEALVRAQRESLLAAQTQLARMEEQSRQAASEIAEGRRREEALRERIGALRQAAADAALPMDDAVESVRAQAEQCRQRQRHCQATLQEFRRTAELIRAADGALRQADDACAQAVLAEKTAEFALRAARNEEQRRAREQGERWSALQEARRECAAAFLRYGIRSDVVPDHLPEELRQLEQRAQYRLEAVRRQETLHQESVLLVQKKIHATEATAQAREECRRHAGALREAEDVLRRRQEERAALGVGADPEQEEQRLQSALTEGDRRLENARRALTTTEQRRLVAEESLAARRNAVQEGRFACRAAEEALQRCLLSRNFAREQDMREAMLDDAERRDWENRIDAVRMREGALRLGLEQTRAGLRSLEERRETPLDTPALRLQAEGVAEELRLVQQRMGACRQTLHAAERQREQQKAVLAQMEEGEAALRRWQELDALIGAAEGKTYRKFVQGLTFERLLRHANRRLQDLSDRYVLLADPTRHLEFLVMDNYQAGECRSARNLSGGESFLVSLALALGLSRMSGHSIRIESLFLDEGFGTLDEDALDAALSVLSRLRREGTLIGIISHVPALRERIPAQIAVIPGAGGRSRVEGDGCTKIQ